MGRHARLRSRRPRSGLGGSAVFASRARCSNGCPVPGSAGFTFSDGLHITTAVAGFALVCLTMLIMACSPGSSLDRVLAAVACVAVGAVSATGGLLALARTATDLGSWLEFIAMSAALAWGAIHACRAVWATRRIVPSARSGGPYARRTASVDST